MQRPTLHKPSMHKLSLAVPQLEQVGTEAQPAGIPYQALLDIAPLLLVPSINDAVSEGKIWQDSAGTIAADTDGDPVGLIEDFSGNGNDLAQITSTARPLLKHDGTNWYIKRDGIDDSLDCTLTPGAVITLAQAYDTDGDTTGIFLSFSATTPWVFVHESGSVSTVLSGGYVFTAIYVDGALEAVTTRGDLHTAIVGKKVSIWEGTTDQVVRDFTFGQYPTASYNMSGRQYCFMLHNAAFTAQNRADVDSYFASQSGVTL